MDIFLLFILQNVRMDCMDLDARNHVAIVCLEWYVIKSVENAVTDVKKAGNYQHAKLASTVDTD